MLERLKPFSPYAWMPILIVGVISATLAYRNLSLQQAGNRPGMPFKRVEFGDPYGAATPIKRQEEFSANIPVVIGKFLDVLALCKTFHDDDGEQFTDPMFDPNADVCCLILAELSGHRGKILRVVCHKPSSKWRSNGDVLSLPTVTNRCRRSMSEGPGRSACSLEQIV
jgi:hypothetical protein